MSNGKMWMGVRGHEQWVPAPSIGGDWSSVGWSKSVALRNGGTRITTSRATHKEYNMSWAIAPRDSLRSIMDMYSGIYGDELIYFLDPFAADKNVLPALWGFPALAGTDGVPIIGKKRPSMLTTGANTLGYPVQSAQYASGTSKKLYVPVPPGYTAWVGAHGVVSASGVKVTAIVPGSTTGPQTTLAVLAVTDENRFNGSYSGSQYSGIELELIAGATLAGVMVQVLPSSATPATGGYISGQGHSGCRFETSPSQTAYSAGIDRVGMTAKLIEVGSWL